MTPSAFVGANVHSSTELLFAPHNHAVPLRCALSLWSLLPLKA